MLLSILSFVPSDPIFHQNGRTGKRRLYVVAFLTTAEIAEHAKGEIRPGIYDDPSPKRQRGVENRSLALAARREYRVNAHGRLGSHDYVFPDSTSAVSAISAVTDPDYIPEPSDWPTG